MRTIEKDEDSNLVMHAKRELELCGWYEDGSGDPECADSMVEAVRAFASYGHSGGSAPVCVHILSELLLFRPLGPITDNPNEWQDVHEMMDGHVCYQNRRDGRLFSYDSGKTYYNIDDPRWRKRRPWNFRAWLWRRNWNKIRVAAGEHKMA